jgi:hypothetical protein
MTKKGVVGWDKWIANQSNNQLAWKRHYDRSVDATRDGRQVDIWGVNLTIGLQERDRAVPCPCKKASVFVADLFGPQWHLRDYCYSTYSWNSEITQWLRLHKLHRLPWHGKCCAVYAWQMHALLAALPTNRFVS